LIWAKAKGARAIVVSELAPGRTELAMKLGATAVVNPTQNDPAEAVRQITGRPPEIVFECIGVKSTLDSAIRMLGRHGKVVVIGVCMEADSIHPMSCVMKEVQIQFALAYTRADFQETIEAVSNGTIDATPMITDVINIDEVPAMFTALKRPGPRAKVMVEFPH
jgi:threonine dehydrogenase-like Zn-dependent dehydrogenase